MENLIRFQHGERVWEQTKFGWLVRVDAFYTLYPYLFAFFDDDIFKVAQEYAEYEAYNYYLGAIEKGPYSDEELTFLHSLIEINSLKAADKHKYNKKNDLGFKDLISMTPDRPKLLCCCTKQKEKDQHSEQREIGISREKRVINYFGKHDPHRLLDQHAIVADFCNIARNLHIACEDHLFEHLDIRNSENISKKLVFDAMDSLKLTAGEKREDVELFVNKFSPIAPLICAITKCVEFGYEMREHFVNNFCIIAAWQAEIYDIVVDKAFKSGREAYFTPSNVYKLDLPPSPSGTPRPTKEQLKSLIAAIE